MGWSQWETNQEMLKKGNAVYFKDIIDKAGSSVELIIFLAWMVGNTEFSKSEVAVLATGY